MTKIGMDLGKRRSDVCVMSGPNEVAERFQVGTTREALGRAFGNRPAATIAIEACRDSRWVHETLVRLGHEVVVIDTTRARAIGVGQGRRKTDRRDAEALARVLWTGVIPRAHVLSDRAAALRDVLWARAQLVAQRAALVTQLRGQMQARGIVVPSGTTQHFVRRLREAAPEEARAEHVQALVAVIEVLAAQIDRLEGQLRGLAEREESFERLCSVPGVKLITALAVIAALDRADRFAHAHQVQAYLGLVPSEATTGGKRKLGRITKAGNPMARRALVQAAHCLLRTRGHENDPLVLWARQLEARRGKRIAVLGVARRLAGVLWAMWMDGTYYDPAGLARASAAGLSRRARRARFEARTMEAAARAA